MSPPPSPRRALPSIPPRPRRLSRPLPSIPLPISCKCGTCITSYNALMPPSAIPPESPRNFKGFSGRASLFTATYNVSQLAPKVQLMATGAHLLAELNCNTCSQYLGYKIVRAFDKSEEWKQDRFLLELAELNNPYTHFFPESDESDDSS